jgi:nucleolar protein 58
LDDLDKELNTYAMRVREWYGWHFPEMSKVIPDNLLYAKVVKKMGMQKKFTAVTFLQETEPTVLPPILQSSYQSKWRLS